MFIEEIAGLLIEQAEIIVGNTLCAFSMNAKPHPFNPDLVSLINERTTKELIGLT